MVIYQTAALLMMVWPELLMFTVVIMSCGLRSGDWACRPVSVVCASAAVRAVSVWLMLVGRLGAWRGRHVGIPVLDRRVDIIFLDVRPTLETYLKSSPTGCNLKKIFNHLPQGIFKKKSSDPWNLKKITFIYIKIDTVLKYVSMNTTTHTYG